MAPSAALFFFFFLLLLISNVSSSALLPRDSTSQTCANLHAKSNNGDRKIAIVIDSSGSMVDSDPYNLRLAAGRDLVNNWLISSKEATSTSKADLVTVINFDTEAYIDYPLGDPAGANSSFDKIGADGGTYIAGGVLAAIKQLTQSGTGTTAGRSGILVFTDGEDENTQSLVDQINNATSLGIRVSFGFLDATNGLQDKRVLLAIEHSGGIYNTIVSEASSEQYINLVIVNGLTTNDNPAGSNSTLVSGLSIAHFISGSQSQSIIYDAQSNEIIDFTIQSVDAGRLSVKAMFGGQTLNTTTANDTDSEPSDLIVHSPGAGEIDIVVTASNAQPESMFVVGAMSNMPVQNCTVGYNNGGGGDPKKAGAISVSVIVPIAVFAAVVGAAYWWNRTHLPMGAPKVPPAAPTVGGQGSPPPVDPEKFAIPPYPFGPGAPPPPTHPGDPHPDHHKPDQQDMSDCSCSEPSDNEANLTPNNPDNKHKHHKHKHRKRRHDDRHHHHLDREHPCYDPKCPLNGPSHECQDPGNVPCVCEDEKCPSIDKEHKCEDDRWKCPCTDKECPVNKEKKRERRKEKLEGMAISGVKEGISLAIRQVTG